MGDVGVDDFSLVGASPTQKSLHGDTSLTFAADVGNFEWVKRFHSLGCDVVCVSQFSAWHGWCDEKPAMGIPEFYLKNQVLENLYKFVRGMDESTLQCEGWKAYLVNWDEFCY